jgi:hypothetical protein
MDMSKERKERKEDLIDAYLRRVDEGGDVPSLSDLPADDRSELEATFKMLDSIAGIDANLVPNLEDDPVARGLGFVPGAGADVASLVPEPVWRQAVTREIEQLNRAASIERDVEANQIPEVRSDLLLRVGGMRMRVVRVESDELQDPSELLLEANRVFTRFPETVAIACVAFDEELLTQVVEARDCRSAIETPAGKLVPPRPRRPQLPLRSALVSYLEGVEPIWDPPSAATGIREDASSVEEIAHEVASSVIGRLSEDGSKARTPAKRETWIPLGDREVRHVARLVIDVHRGSIESSDIAAREQQIIEDVA